MYIILFVFNFHKLHFIKFKFFSFSITIASPADIDTAGCGHSNTHFVYMPVDFPCKSYQVKPLSSTYRVWKKRDKHYYSHFMIVVYLDDII